MSRTLAKMAVLSACLGLFACGPADEGNGGGGGSGGTGGTGGSVVPPSVCGNGIQEDGEDCDDGNSVNEDDCLDTCRAASCGDGFVKQYGDNTEECDEGAGNSDSEPNGCRTDCKVAHCGDGVIDQGEVCDEGVENSDTLAGACRSGEILTGQGCQMYYCGDGVTDPGEQCDDANTNDNDGCRSDCTAAVCGDGVRDFGEECDDGNRTDGDACTNNCTNNVCGDGILFEGVEACDDANRIDTDACTNTCTIATCGDGVVWDGVEGCDDGNSDNADACRNNCAVPSCGNGLLDRETNEQCDDGNADDTDACLSTCRWAKCGDGVVRPGVEPCDPYDMNDPNRTICRSNCTLMTCGDGIVDPGEQCDDANTNENDACLHDCHMNICGDGVVRTGIEQCDNGAANSDTAPDACRASSCQLAHCGDGVTDTGEACDGQSNCTPTCTVNRCGDGVVLEGELCDNGTANSDTAANACRTTCTPASCGDGVRDAGEACDTGAARSDTVANACRMDCSAARCGDNVVDTGEQCDSGANNSNTVANACRTTCQMPRCGDSVVDNGEHCDDGNSSNTDSCAACVTAFCGDGYVQAGVEQCDDANASNADGCMPTTCRVAVTSSFTGLGTLEATMRGLTSMTAAVDAGFDPNAMLRWKITITNSSNQPVAGVRAYYNTGETTSHETWTAFIESDAQGISWFGPVGGFTAAQAGLTAAGGVTTQFSTLYAASGSYNMKVELVNLGTNAAVGTFNQAVTVGAKKFNATFNGFNTIREAVRTAASMNTTLASGLAGTTAVHFRMTVTQNGAPIQGIRAYYGTGTDHTAWTTFIETNAQGQADYGTGITASQLQASGGLTSNFSWLIPLAGTYDLYLELLDGSNNLIGWQRTQLVADYEKLVSTFGFANFADNIRQHATFTTHLDSRYTSAGVNAKWKITVTDGANAPIASAKFYYPVSGDGTDHRAWTTFVSTGANGTADFIPAGFPVSDLQPSGGVTWEFSAAIPGTGARKVKFELIKLSDSSTIDADTASFTSAPSLVASYGYGTIRATVRGLFSMNAQLHASFDPTAQLQWKFTVLNGTTGVSGVQFYYPVSGDGFSHTSWTNHVDTGSTGSTAVWPTTPFVAQGSNLQTSTGEDYAFSMFFPTAGTFAVKAELVLASSPATVVGSYSSNVTVAP